MSIDNQKEKIAAGIVLYNPELKRLQENIGHIIDQVDQIVLFDNGSNNILNVQKLLLNWGEKIVLIKNDSNIGIASALNRLCRWAFEQNYQYILTLDQDSVCPNGIIDKLLKDMKPNIAIAAPNIIYRNNETFYERKKGVESVEWVITSASLTDLSIWNIIGGFDEKLFIDGVDKDFCYRAREQGYRILKDFDIELLHELGNLSCRKIFGRTIYVTNHSAVRKYYMVRNAFYLDKKHSSNKRYAIVLKNIFKTVIYEENKVSKIRAIYKGIIDGVKMKNML